MPVVDLIARSRCYFCIALLSISTFDNAIIALLSIELFKVGRFVYSVFLVDWDLILSLLSIDMSNIICEKVINEPDYYLITVMLGRFTQLLRVAAPKTFLSFNHSSSFSTLPTLQLSEVYLTIFRPMEWWCDLTPYPIITFIICYKCCRKLSVWGKVRMRLLLVKILFLPK